MATMFDFLFKRRSGAAAGTVVGTAASVATSHSAAATPGSAVPTAAANADRKQAALAQAESFSGNEAAAVDFILQSEFADARFIAAQQVHSPQMLERLLPPMRKSDRRVARLVQQRLDALVQQQRTARQAEACIDSARQLLAESHLLPNQVVELDRGWRAIAAVSELQRAQYQPLHAALDQRLLAQSALQRAAIDTLRHLRQLQKTVATADVLPPPQDITRALEMIEGAMANHLAAAEAASLPRHVRTEFEQQRETFGAAWQQARQRAEAHAAQRQALTAWEAELNAALAADSVTAPAALQPQAWQRQWQELAMAGANAGAAPGDPARELEQEFQALLARASAAQVALATAPHHSDRPAQQQQAPMEMLSALEEALQQGALQEALDCDSALRALDLKPAALSALQASRLAAARLELSRLQGWARWGGNVSRAELLKTVQELPGRALPPPELAKQVGALRACWKALDASAGVAAQDMWRQFDAACTLAYAPAAEYFGKLAEQRREALAQAEALLAQVQHYARDFERDFRRHLEQQAAAGGAEAGPEADAETLAEATSKATSEIGVAVADSSGPIDWKEVAAFCTRLQQAWLRLGHLERKEKKRLEREFEAALQRVRQPLAQQQAAAIAQREQLIAAVLALEPAARDMPEALRTLQQRWQQMAQAVPLERRQEQQLWQRFRGACDQAFAQRKQAAASSEQLRQRHLQDKEALCQLLEQGRHQPVAQIRQLLARSEAAWAGIGAVPRAQEAPLEQRRQAALAALRATLEQAKRAAGAAACDSLRGKLALCQELEQQLVTGSSFSAQERQQAHARWQALPALADAWEQALRGRFDALWVAVDGAGAEYALQLEQNQPQLLQALLQLEILNGVDSPAEWSRQRLQLQVEVLAAKLKRGDAAESSQAQLVALCALPALTDHDASQRCARLLQPEHADAALASA
jgi:DNA repair protein SbcC/Rad50